jgi:MerR family transcriptional regulator, repressor of the yfmOP operon
MSATATPPLLRIGDVARLVGTTPRTIRYYEEKGLLPPAEGRPAGQHRLYDEAAVERLREVLRLKELLGLSLEELKALVAAEEERALLRAEFRRGASPARQERILRRLREVADLQLALVERRASELDALRGEIRARQARIDELLAS